VRHALATKTGLLAVVMSMAALSAVILTAVTAASLKPVPQVLLKVPGTVKPQVLDRRGQPLTITYQNHWNLHDRRALHEIPGFLQQAFILAEDKRFHAHNGVDWGARLHALWQNLIHGRVVRGASTVSEQVVRLLQPRPRTIWSRWLEGWQARRLEGVFSKADILEFYLNQVPYGANRRGVVQAARHYFDRDLATLNRHEMLALAVLVRAPSRLDPRRDEAALQKSVETLARRARREGLISPQELAQVSAGRLDLASPSLPVHARHFAEHVLRRLSDRGLANVARIHTTLDAELQRKAQAILDERLASLADHDVHNAALLIVNHDSDEILAWVGAHEGQGSAASWYDPVVVPRQPGSTLKPFVYAAALEKGWTAATLIDDSPLAERVLRGLHDYRNYSRRHYGPVRLRDALGNSLNVPAVKAVQHVGNDHFLERLNRLGVQSLRQHPDYYGDGLALGNGEITLLELVGAYATLARHGVYRPLRSIQTSRSQAETRLVFSPEVSSLIADILSDQDARTLEFGRGSLLQFPVQTAIKTGTSSDYRDAWAIAFNRHYTAGVWMGNLNDQPMEQVTGARGPVLVLRSLFAELNRYTATASLRRSATLVMARICRDTGGPANGTCATRDEWFRRGKVPVAATPRPMHDGRAGLRRPSNGLMLAMDPRIPDDLEAFEFLLEGFEDARHIEWYVDGRAVHSGRTGVYLWPLTRGDHVAWAKVWRHPDDGAYLTPAVTFSVK
jgi:penicillin-binding protein 1C